MTTTRLGGAFIKSQAFFLSEPSVLSQVTALSLLIEVLEFRRPKYLLAIALGFVTAFSGTGLMLLLVFLPVTGLRNSKAGLSALLVIVFALGLVASGAIDVSVWSS